MGELVKRGVLSKVRHSKGYRKGVYYAYKWTATSEPTPHFVRSVADAIHKNQKEQTARRYSAQPPQAPSESFIKRIEVSLSEFSSEELWAELKRRGAVIKNNKLMIVTYKELE